MNYQNNELCFFFENYAEIIIQRNNLLVIFYQVKKYWPFECFMKS